VRFTPRPHEVATPRAAPSSVDSFEPAPSAPPANALAAPAAPSTDDSVSALLQELVSVVEQLLAKLFRAPAPAPAPDPTPAPVDATPSPAPAPAPVPAPADPTPAPRSADEAYRALIDADMRTAHSGRPATADDYAYWLPKLEGGCDTSLVTGGQLTATEYWHRRMLGWEAGGSDAATSGPYQGGEQVGPVPSATDVVSDVPPGFAVND
jgi:hypothetical protein